MIPDHAPYQLKQHLCEWGKKACRHTHPSRSFFLLCLCLYFSSRNEILYIMSQKLTCFSFFLFLYTFTLLCPYFFVLFSLCPLYLFFKCYLFLTEMCFLKEVVYENYLTKWKQYMQSLCLQIIVINRTFKYTQAS